MSQNTWFFILLIFALGVLLLLPEIIGWLLMIGSKESPQHKRRAVKRVKIWYAIIFCVCSCLFWYMSEAPRGILEIFGLTALSAFSLLFLYGAIKPDKKYLCEDRNMHIPINSRKKIK